MCVVQTWKKLPFFSSLLFCLLWKLCTFKQTDTNYCFYSKEFNIEVLKCFIGLHDFTGKSLVDALRYVVSSNYHTPHRGFFFNRDNL